MNAPTFSSRRALGDSRSPTIAGGIADFSAPVFLAGLLVLCLAACHGPAPRDVVKPKAEPPRAAVEPRDQAVMREVARVRDDAASVEPAPAPAPARVPPAKVTPPATGDEAPAAAKSSAAAPGTPQIHDAALKAAIQSALEGLGIFRRVIQQGGAEYELTVRQTRLDKPVYGLKMTVELDAVWTLVRTSDHKVVVERTIASSFMTTAADSLNASTRLQMAIEGAIRDNITFGVRAIADAKM